MFINFKCFKIYLFKLANKNYGRKYKKIKKNNSEYVFQLKKENESISESKLLKLSKKDVKELEIENYCKTDTINFKLLKEHKKVKFISKDFVIRKLTFYDVNSRKNIECYAIKDARDLKPYIFKTELEFFEDVYEEWDNELFGTMFSGDRAMKTLKKNYPKRFFEIKNNFERKKAVDKMNIIFQKIFISSRKIELEYGDGTVTLNQTATFEKNNKILERTLKSYYGINFMALTEKCRGKEKTLALFFSETLSGLKVPVFHNKIKIEAKIGSSTFGFCGNLLKDAFFFENYGTGESFSIKHNEVKNVKISFGSTIVEDFEKFVEKLVPCISETDRRRLKKSYKILSDFARIK